MDTNGQGEFPHLPQRRPGSFEESAWGFSRSHVQPQPHFPHLHPPTHSHAGEVDPAPRLRFSSIPSLNSLTVAKTSHSNFMRPHPQPQPPVLGAGSWLMVPDEWKEWKKHADSRREQTGVEELWPGFEGDEDPARTLVVHPGSRSLYVGRVADSIPNREHHVVARRVDTVALLGALRDRKRNEGKWRTGEALDVSEAELREAVGWGDGWEDEGDGWYADGVVAGWGAEGWDGHKSGTTFTDLASTRNRSANPTGSDDMELDVPPQPVIDNAPASPSQTPPSPSSPVSPSSPSAPLTLPPFPSLATASPTFSQTLSTLAASVRSKTLAMRASGVQSAHEKCLAANSRAADDFTRIQELSDRNAVHWTPWGLGVTPDGNVVGEQTVPPGLTRGAARGPPPGIFTGMEALALPQASLPSLRDGALLRLLSAFRSPYPAPLLAQLPPLYVIRRPIRHSALNATSYTSLHQVESDLAASWTDAYSHLTFPPDPTACRTLLVAPDTCTRTYLAAMVRAAWGTGARAVAVVRESVAAAVGGGFAGGCVVVDVGAESCKVAVVEEGCVVEATRILLHYGSDDGTDLMSLTLSSRAFPYRAFNPHRSLTDHLLVAQRFKEDHTGGMDFAGLAGTRSSGVEVRRPGAETRVWTLRWWDEGVVAGMVLFYPQLINHRRKLRGLLHPRYFSGGFSTAFVKGASAPVYTKPPSVDLVGADEWAIGTDSPGMAIGDAVKRVRDHMKKQRKIEAEEASAKADDEEADKRQLRGAAGRKRPRPDDGDATADDGAVPSSESRAVPPRVQTPLDTLAAAQDPLDVAVARSLILYHHHTAANLAATSPKYVPDPTHAAQVSLPAPTPIPGLPPTPLHPGADERLRRMAETVLLCGGGAQTRGLAEYLQERVQARLNEFFAAHVPHLYWGVSLVEAATVEKAGAAREGTAEAGSASESVQDTQSAAAGARGKGRGRGRGRAAKPGSAPAPRPAPVVPKPVPAQGPPKVLIIYPPPRDVPAAQLSWKGAAVMARLEAWKDTWIGRGEWERAGVARVAQAKWGYVWDSLEP